MLLAGLSGILHQAVSSDGDTASGSVHDAACQRGDKVSKVPHSRAWIVGLSPREE